MGEVKLEFVQDAENSGRGPVLKGTILGNGSDKDGYTCYRGYPGKDLPALRFPFLYEEDIFMSSKLFNSIVLGRSGRWFSHMGVFDDVKNWIPAVTTIIMSSTDRHFTLDVQESGQPNIIFNFLQKAPEFTPDQWHRMGIWIEEDGRVTLYQDGQSVCQAKLNIAKRIRMVHGGPIYGGPDFPIGSYAMIDNIKILSWV